MYAAHFAAALAIKSRAPRAPVWALVVGAFLPDLFWIGLGLAGVEPSQGARFFDDWSHSLASVLLTATVWALAFRRQGRQAALAVGLAVVSHFLLDLPIHPKNLALYPHSTLHLGWNLWRLGPRFYWYVQLGVLLALMAVYVEGALRLWLPKNLILASALLLFSLHLLTY